jgi:hypothetical protein
MKNAKRDPGKDSLGGLPDYSGICNSAFLENICFRIYRYLRLFDFIGLDLP